MVGDADHRTHLPGWCLEVGRIERRADKTVSHDHVTLLYGKDVVVIDQCQYGPASNAATACCAGKILAPECAVAVNIPPSVRS